MSPPFMIFNNSTLLWSLFFHAIHQPAKKTNEGAIAPYLHWPSISVSQANFTEVSEEKQAWTREESGGLRREEALIAYRICPSVQQCSSVISWRMLFLNALWSWLLTSPEPGSTEGGPLQVFPCRSSGLHPAVPSVLRGAQPKVSLHPCCRGNLGHDSGILHQPVLSPTLPKAASSVSIVFEQVPSESSIEIVQQGRPGRQQGRGPHAAVNLYNP